MPPVPRTAMISYGPSLVVGASAMVPIISLAPRWASDCAGSVHRCARSAVAQARELALRPLQPRVAGGNAGLQVGERLAISRLGGGQIPRLGADLGQQHHELEAARSAAVVLGGAERERIRARRRGA